jgi:NAD+ synthase
MKESETIDHIVDWIKDYQSKNKIKGLVIGVSGGIDSALTSTLCALTGLNTLCLNMPIRQKKEQFDRAAKHISWLKNKFENVNSVNIDLTPFFEKFESTVDTSFDKSDLGLANSRSRMRMLTLYYYAGISNSIVVGTGNKVEDFGIGFYTKYGDGGVDISPIADLMKSEVYELSKYLEISNSILNAPPTDGLWDDDRSDEDQIGVSYEDLENIMNRLENGEDPKEFDVKIKSFYEVYMGHHKSNKHKMVEIPVCKIPSKFKL